MAKKMLIDATHPEETRVVVVDGGKVEEFDFEAEAKRQLSGNIYLAKITRVEPSLQAAFVDYGGNRHGFLAFSEIHPDYYQIPVADREALLAEEQAEAEAEAAEEDRASKKRTRSRGGSAAARSDGDAVASAEPAGADGPAGMEVVGDDAGGDDVPDDDDGTLIDAAVEAVKDVAGAVADTIGGGDDDAAAAVDVPEDEGGETPHEEARPRRKPKARRYKIQEVVKVRQIMLVQVVKEERGNKGAALTTYLSLAGRYCVLMPNTARGGGISRKITNAADRKKLKEIASEIEVPKGAGLIVRTAGAKRTKSDIKRDYEYLQRLWEQVRELTLKSIAPAKIYEEGDLIKRSIRDLYNREIDEVIVDGEAGYRTALDFMKMIMPTHAKNVRRHADPLPLFAKHQIESTLSAMFNPTVQLPSGGYIVIGVTEALVAVDVNSGRSTKEGSIEDTALKTNLEAASEVARQAKLRDLAGLIVVDFIDMDERRNNAAVEKRMKDALKADRARIQIGRISAFGLMEMSRQRLRPGMLELSTRPCPSCHGTGLVRSDDSLALSILRQLEEEGVRRRSREVLLRAPVEVVNYLFNAKREAVAALEARYGMSVRIEGAPDMVAPDFTVEKFKTQTRRVEAAAPVVTGGTAIEEDEGEGGNAWDDEPEEVAVAPAEPEELPSAEDGEEGSRSRGGRRRRGRSKRGKSEDAGDEPSAEAESAEAEGERPSGEGSDEDGEGKPKRRRRSRGGRGRKRSGSGVPADGAGGAEVAAGAAPDEDAADAYGEPVAAVAPVPVEAAVAAELPPAVQSTLATAEAPRPEPEAGTSTEEVSSMPAEPDMAPPPSAAPVPSADGDGAREAGPEPAPEPDAAPTPEPMPEVAAEAEAEAAPEPPAKPKRRGWWSLGR